MWRKKKSRVNIIVRAHNIIKEPNAVKGSAVNATTPKDYWNQFNDETMMVVLVNCTNAYINEYKLNYSRIRYARNTLEEEASSFIGFCTSPKRTKVADSISMTYGPKMVQD